MVRIKSKERSWRRKASLTVVRYRITSTDGNNYYVYANNFGDLEYLFPSIEIQTYSRDCEDHFEKRRCWTCMCKGQKPISRPFWYYGRIYRA
jgi:hypothetical protein